MKRSSCLFLGALIASCFGCGGGDGSSAYASTPSMQQQRAVLVETYGDSTTDGMTVINGVAVKNPNNQIAILQTLLQQRFGKAVTVSNHGVSGTEASQLLNGTDGRHPTWTKQMAQSKADVVLIEFGLNDTFFFGNPRAGVESESPDRFEQIVAELVAGARAAGKKVVLIEPGPSCNPNRQATLPYYVMRVDNVAKNLDVPLVQHYWPIVARPDWQALLSDCTHPTTELYSMHARATFDVIAPIVMDLMNPTARKQ
ncbi:MULTISPECIES: SGNH/GDSL hydrolase family protein [Burkholderia]|uniref:SGNH/GDSL hydrolase family protein n=1 Tax=Burkholderia TaxID=32008 RepID=UPI0013C4F3D6|nr:MULTISPECIES: SGNH/GDSL hydrolase family protein [Burkholderia]